MEEEQRWEEEMRGTGLPLWLAVFGSDVSMNFSPHRQKLATTKAADLQLSRRIAEFHCPCGHWCCLKNDRKGIQ